MRLAVIGPANDATDALDGIGRFLLGEASVDRALYLGADDALERAVQRWAEDIVGEDASEQGVWQRAARDCVKASPDQIDAFLERERRRAQLRIFQTLPALDTRAVEMMAGKVVVMLYDKADLDEEDMLPAALLVYGKASKSLVKQVGNRWFLTPGSLPGAGLMIIEDRDEGIVLEVYDSECVLQRTEHLATTRAAKMRVSGG